MDLSIVTTMYYSKSYLPEFYERITTVAANITPSFELIFVNDGSPDDSLAFALSLFQQDDRVKVVDLSRNFGHHKAMMTGLAHAQGDLVFLIDCDLEEEPELLNQFYHVLQETDMDVVYGVQTDRKGAWFERVSGDLFWKLFNRFSNYPVPASQLVARLMTQKYVKSLVAHRDREVFIPGLWAITGFKQKPIEVVKLSKGSSTYTLGKKIGQFVDALTSFSSAPLVVNFYLGSAIVGMSVIAALYLVMRKILFGEYLSGWPSLIVSIWLLGGLTIFCLGVIGIYLAKIFAEIKDRPFTVVRDFHTREPVVQTRHPNSNGTILTERPSEPQPPLQTSDSVPVSHYTDGVRVTNTG